MKILPLEVYKNDAGEIVLVQEMDGVKNEVRICAAISDAIGKEIITLNKPTRTPAVRKKK